MFFIFYMRDINNISLLPKYILETIKDIIKTNKKKFL